MKKRDPVIAARLPQQLHDTLLQFAEHNHRSLARELQFRLEQTFERDKKNSTDTKIYTSISQILPIIDDPKQPPLS